MKINKIWFLGLGIALLLIAIFTQGFGFLNFNQPDLTINNEGIITIPLSEISENAKWHEYNDVSFFVVKASDGTIRTAFNKCDVCYWAGRGYSQEGSDMICNNCGLRFAIDGLGIENQTPGGCWPSYLPHTLENDNVIIRAPNLGSLIRNDQLFNEAKNQGNRPSDLEEECDLETGTCFIL